MHIATAKTWAAILGWALTLPVVAQQMTLEPSAAVSCLTPAEADRGAPEYPFEQFKAGEKGRVRVALAFTTPQAPPAVDVVAQEGASAFVDAVRQHVRNYRVPCHDGANPVTLSIEFVFRPDDRQVQWPVPEDLGDARRKAQLECVAHVSGAKAPAYPRDAERSGTQGRILVRLRYAAADQPPAAEFLLPPGAMSSSRLRRDLSPLLNPLEAWVAGYRMPCFQGEPITTTVTFVYSIEGSGYGFQSGLSLQALLSQVRDIRKQRLAFDFNGMGCPFDVALQYRRPQLPNLVGELGDRNPARRPFLEWLSKVEFDLPVAVLDSIYGDTTRFTVPCLKLDLQPQASS